MCIAVILRVIFLSAGLSDIVDIKPANMEELTEVITSAEFHPQHCHTFAYSSSKGSIRLCDMRQAALCDRHCKCEYWQSASWDKEWLSIKNRKEAVIFIGFYSLQSSYCFLKILEMSCFCIEFYQWDPSKNLLQTLTDSIRFSFQLLYSCVVYCGIFSI